MTAFVPWAITSAILAGAVAYLAKRIETMSEALDNLQAAVDRNTSVDASVVTLIQGLAAQIKEASPDPRIQALADQLNAATDVLAGAVTANTPAAPPADTGGGTGSTDAPASQDAA